ncbi:glutathione S-transferase A3-like isoform X2 [Diceros bicornis minor]|uniref:glutathione S-transferase A3-like isoform X2 n=1 Tax=Diceros bicornis minor TaxID=77932 RepID=UPI0026F36F3A|nr:glutathione S-transferase A3-like isoform X2 [Diceros bicornis minor]
MAAANVPVPGGVSPLAEMHSEPIRNPEPGVMAAKPKLYYFRGRGRMEPIRWLLAAAGVEFEEKFIDTPEDLEKLQNDGSLMFQQVPMVEIDGMKLARSRAILSSIAAKYNLYGKDIKERALIDMYIEGIADLMEMILVLRKSPPDEKDAKITLIKDWTIYGYFFVFEKVLQSHGQDYLVGNMLSRADTQLVELLYSVEELDPGILANFPLLKARKTRISNLPTMKQFLQPCSQRKPPVNEKSSEQARKIFQ